VRLLPPAPPDRGSRKPQHGTVGGIHGQRRVDEQPDILAVADTPEAALARGLGLIVDLAAVLDDQHMAAGRRLARSRRRRAHDLLHRHLGIAKQPRERNLFRARIGQPAQARRYARAHALQHHAPLFCRRRSPKYPSSGAIVETSRINNGSYRITHDSNPASQTCCPTKTPLDTSPKQMCAHASPLWEKVAERSSVG
jgi:hypothetical protein